MTRRMIVIRDEPVAQAVLLGPLNAACGRLLVRKTESLLNAGYRCVRLDLSAITEADDAGTAALVRACRLFEESAGRLSLLGITDELEKRLADVDGVPGEGAGPLHGPHDFGPEHIEEWPHY